MLLLIRLRDSSKIPSNVPQKPLLPITEEHTLAEAAWLKQARERTVV